MARTREYDLGDQPTSNAVFRELPDYGETLGELADPSDIRVVVRAPDGTETEHGIAECVNVSTGIWRFTLAAPVDQTGIWTVKWFGEATIVAAEEAWFRVKCTRVDTD